MGRLFAGDHCVSGLIAILGYFIPNGNYGWYDVWTRLDSTHHQHNTVTTINILQIRENKMELLQSQAPAERELLGNSAVRTLDIRV